MLASLQANNIKKKDAKGEVPFKTRLRVQDPPNSCNTLEFPQMPLTPAASAREKQLPALVVSPITDEFQEQVGEIQCPGLTEKLFRNTPSKLGLSWFPVPRKLSMAPARAELGARGLTTSAGRPDAPRMPSLLLQLTQDYMVSNQNPNSPEEVTL